MVARTAAPPKIERTQSPTPPTPPVASPAEETIDNLEPRVETARRESSDALYEKVGALAASSPEQQTTLPKDTTDRLDGRGSDLAARLRAVVSKLTEQIDQQDGDQLAQLRSAQQGLSERLDRPDEEHAAQWRDAQKGLSERTEGLAAGPLNPLRANHLEFSDRRDQLSAKLSERSRAAQTETRQSDDGLRQQLLALTAALDDGKTSRHELGRRLLELGQRLRDEVDPAESAR